MRPKQDYALDRLNVLVVDDNKHMRALVKTILHALAIKNILEAGDGADAFKELRHFSADLIICDWSMSPLDGLDFVRLVRTGKDSPNPYVPIIMLTGHTEMHRVIEARECGINEFLAKPISAHGLYARMRQIIENPRSFIRTAHYFGPDRRRRQSLTYSGAERRKIEATPVPEATASRAAESAPASAPGGGLNQDEVEALLRG